MKINFFSEPYLVPKNDIYDYGPNNKEFLLLVDDGYVPVVYIFIDSLNKFNKFGMTGKLTDES